MSAVADLSQTSPLYDPNCRRCPRLATFLDQVKAENPGYFCRPVPPFGDPHARLVIVGLAPGMHGANRTGRPFTGDYAGILLYRSLYEAGFATQPESVSANDPLRLIDCRINNSVKCLPPANKPLPEEIRNCNAYLRADLTNLPRGTALLALGRIAFDAALVALGERPSAWKFAHGARHTLPSGHILFASYHCSRYNTQTNRLTGEMFKAVLAEIRAYLDAQGAT
jgi:uracil-DNA glycosylase family 4